MDQTSFVLRSRYVQLRTGHTEKNWAKRIDPMYSNLIKRHWDVTSGAQWMNVYVPQQHRRMSISYKVALLRFFCVERSVCFMLCASCVIIKSRWFNNITQQVFVIKGCRFDITPYHNTTVQQRPDGAVVGMGPKGWLTSTSCPIQVRSLKQWWGWDRKVD